jgi:hypothetical protein
VDLRQHVLGSEAPTKESENPDDARAARWMERPAEMAMITLR